MRYAKLSCTEFYPYYLQQCHSIGLFFYMKPWPWPEGSYEKGLSVLPFRSFHGMGSLGFFASSTWC